MRIIAYYASNMTPEELREFKDEASKLVRDIRDTIVFLRSHVTEICVLPEQD